MARGVKIFSLLVFFPMVLTVAIHFDTAYASEGTLKPEIVQSEYADNNLFLYIRNLESDTDNLQYQIGNRQVNINSVGKLLDGERPINTIIMLDNSISISDEDKEKAIALMKDIVDASADREEIRIATFSEHISFLTDYTADRALVKAAIEGIEFVDQETYLTDALYEELDERDRSGITGFQRMVIISDGVDNKPVGITQGELYNRIKNDSLQIYSIGCGRTDNNEALKSMFALSRLTNTETFVLDDIEDVSVVSAVMRAGVNDITVVETKSEAKRS